MAAPSLSTRDVNVLEKIKDPDYNPESNILLDPSLPRDPHITDASVYERVIRKEKEIVLSMQQLELQMAGLQPKTIPEPAQEYRNLLRKLDDFIWEYPNYASARNNRVQALRRLYGDTMLIAGPIKSQDTQQAALIEHPEEDEKRCKATQAMEDLEASVRLLTPRMAFAAVSPQAAKTLSLAYTQRAAIYHSASKHFGEGEGVGEAERVPVSVDEGRQEARWDKADFEEAASRDFAFGGRYGNEIAKGLAVSTNPTAKLCGQMVREAMKKEYGPDYGN